MAASEPRRDQRGLVHEVGEIGTGEPRCPARDRTEIDVGFEPDLPRMHAQDLLAPVQIGVADHDLAIETARPEQRRVENVRAVGCRHDDDAVGAREAVHLDEQLVERLFALFVAERRAAAVASDGVELVDEDDAGLVAPRLLEEPPHTRRADAGVHLDEVGTTGRDERHARFAGHRPREQRLARARRADEQDAARNPSADRGEPAGVLQEIDDLPDLVLGFVHARHVVEGDRDVVGIDGPHLLERR